MTENDGGLARPGETRRESHDKIPSGKTTLFQQLVGDVRHCGDEIASFGGASASPALVHLYGEQRDDRFQ
jgi:hypothetical protein